MDADICAASRVLMDWDMTYRDTHGDSRSPLSHSFSHSHSYSHSHSHSSSPSFSFEGESSPLSRSSSISSLSSAYSDSDTSDTEEYSDNARFLISILKKPRHLRGRKQQQQGCERQMSHQRDYGSSGHADRKQEQKIDDADDMKGGECVSGNQDGEWLDLDDEDDESECEIVFERNVTFEDPLATDMVTGVPVAPSSRSRVEWTALKTRERLERRLVFPGRFEEEEEEEDDNMSQDILAERHEHLDGEADGTRGRETGTQRTIDDDDDDVEPYVLGITEAVQSVELERLR